MKLFRDPVPSSINRRANLLEQELKSWWQLPSCTSKNSITARKCTLYLGEKRAHKLYLMHMWNWMAFGHYTLNAT